MASLLHRLVHEDGELKVANLLTLTRGVLIAPILALLWTGHDRWALGLYVAAILTDVLDGWAARRAHRASSYGAQLDATVDNLFSVGILAFLLLAYPEAMARQAFWVWVLFAGPIAYLAVSWLWKRRLMMFHFLSAKLGALLLFLLWPLLAVTGRDEAIVIAALVVGLSRLEQILYMARGGTNLEAPHGLAAVQPPERASSSAR